MNPIYHAIISLLIMLSLRGSLPSVVIGVLLGVFIDVDHVLAGLVRSPSTTAALIYRLEITEYYNFLSYLKDPTYIYWHSAVLIGATILSVLTRQPYGWVFIGHLAADFGGQLL